MQIVYDHETLREYIAMASDISRQHPILVDKYIDGKEVEVDGICDGQNVLIPGIMEHIERAGVHSGDSISVYPPRTLDEATKNTIVKYSVSIAKKLNTIGLFNIQFVIDKANRIYVIEVNPRASRTIPILSKITGVPMVDVATRVIMGEKLNDLGYTEGLLEENDFYAVKAPVFSFSKLKTLDTCLGPEMKSTGEVMGVSKNYHQALYKALIASGMKIPEKGSVLLSLEDTDVKTCRLIAKRLSSIGFGIFATLETHRHIEDLCEGIVDDKDLIDHIKDEKTVMVVNTPTNSLHPSALGFKLRRTCIEYSVTCLTSLDTANAVFEIIENYDKIRDPEIFSLDEYSKNNGGNG
jgi:carbamoyl-phosphate synthase large subunit